MFQRFHAMREEREGGFTLIELLVVILIIAILAAIAIPVFLRQREKAWDSQVQSAVKNAATAEESYSTGHNGSYTTTLTGADSLATEGFRYSADDVKDVAANVNADATAYCVEAKSVHKPAIVWSFSSSSGAPKPEACPAF